MNRKRPGDETDARLGENRPSVGDVLTSLFWFHWPKAPLRQWLVALSTFVALLLGFYFLFSWLYGS